MKITIESTTKIVELQTSSGASMPARVWEGHVIDDDGLPQIPVHCYVTRVAVDKDEMTATFERELQEHRAPSAPIEAIPLRLIL